MTGEWKILYQGYEDVVTADEFANIIGNVNKERELLYPFRGDSRDYFVLYQAAEQISTVPGLMCEIGFRWGGGTRVMIDAAINSQKERTVIAIDPYGSLPYVGREGELISTDYSNAMQKEAMEITYRYVQKYPQINFLFFPLEDIEFFKSFSDGVPVYTNSSKEIVNKYALVHFDGPHSVKTTTRAVKFFLGRTVPGSIFVFDDVLHIYDHDKIKALLESNGWKQIQTTKVKASYVREK